MTPRRRGPRLPPPPRSGRPARTMEERGYGKRHRQVRAQMAREVNAGGAVCWRCRTRILPGEPWDAGHADVPDAKRLGIYAGPEHRGCSRSAGGWKRQGVLNPLPPRRRRGPAAALSFFDTKDDEPQQHSGNNDDD